MKAGAGGERRDRVVSVLEPQDVVVRHMRALPHREVASALRKLRASDAKPVALLAFGFLVLTAARWGEAALAQVVKNNVEAVYRRTDLFERWRRLMEDGAGYPAGGSRQSVSVRLRRSAVVVLPAGFVIWRSSRRPGGRL